jgi:dTDP-4-dehydrorhamnose reductase
MDTKILVTGSSGLVGSRFVELFSHPELLLTPDENEFNLLNLESVKKYLDLHPVSAIINFAAFTDVSAAEKQRDDKSGLCWQINVIGLKNLLFSIDPKKVQFIQISTDMVFSGSSAGPGPYSEDHPLETDSKKLTWYGYTKNQAETVVGKQGTIVRICNPVRANYSLKLDYFRKPLSLYD